MVSLLFILSILPILTVVISILLFKQPIAKALITGIIITFLLNIYVWKADETIVNNLFDVQFNLINHGIDKSHYGRVLFFAFFDSLETVLIISSAILLFKIVIDNGSIRQYVKILEKLSSDIVYLTIFFCFFLGNLFESISSYGVAQALIAPIIYALGLPVTTSVGITLIATIPIYYMNSFNNPSIVGFNVLKLIGYSSQEYFAIIKSSILNALIYSALSNLILIFITCYFVIKALKKGKEKTYLYKYTPFLITAWLVYEFAFFFTYFLIVNDAKGLMLLPFIASILAILYFIVMIKIKLFRPIITLKELKTFETHNKMINYIEENPFAKRIDSKKKILLPVILYSLLAFLLIISSDIKIKEFFSSFEISFVFTIKRFLTNNYITTYYEEKHNFFEYPGLFMLAFVITINTILKSFEMNSVNLLDTKLFKRILEIFLVIFLAHVFAYSMYISSFNSYDIPGMFIIITDELSLIFSDHYELISPYLGLLFGYITGSATVSNLLLTSANVDISNTLDIDMTKLLGLQLIGSALGIGICIIHITVCLNSVIHHKYEYNEHLNNKRSHDYLINIWKLCVPIVVLYSICVLITYLVL